MVTHFQPPGPDRLGRALQLFSHQPVEDGRVGEVALVIGLEQIAEDIAARASVGLNADEPDAAVAGLDIGDHQMTADCGGVNIPLRQRCPHLLLCGVIVADGNAIN